MNVRILLRMYWFYYFKFFSPHKAIWTMGNTWNYTASICFNQIHPSLMELHHMTEEDRYRKIIPNANLSSAKRRQKLCWFRLRSTETLNGHSLLGGNPCVVFFMWLVNAVPCASDAHTHNRKPFLNVIVFIERISRIKCFPVDV